MILMTITTENLMIYMQVIGILTHTLLIGWGIAKLMRKIKAFKSKSDIQTK